MSIFDSIAKAHGLDPNHPGAAYMEPVLRHIERSVGLPSPSCRDFVVSRHPGAHSDGVEILNERGMPLGSSWYDVEMQIREADERADAEAEVRGDYHSTETWDVIKDEVAKHSMVTTNALRKLIEAAENHLREGEGYAEDLRYVILEGRAALAKVRVR